MRLYASLILCFSIFSIACNSSKSTEDSPETKVEEKISLKYKLTPFEPSVEYPDATIGGMDYLDGKFSFDVQGEKYVLGEQSPDKDQKMCANSGKGQHIHLIVDNKPYAAKYTKDFEYEIEDGEHYLLAFLSRSYHESIKTTAAHIAVKADISNNSLGDIEPIDKAMVFYSRPKGTYIGKDTEKVMLDFYIKNCRLGDQYSIEANINGEKHQINTWQPYYIEGLPMGENKITLTLLDKEENVVDSPLNPVTRKFTLKANPDPE